MFLSQHFVDSMKKKSPETIQNQNRSAAIFFRYSAILFSNVLPASPTFGNELRGQRSH